MLEKVGFYQVAWDYFYVIGLVTCFWTANPRVHLSRPSQVIFAANRHCSFLERSMITPSDISSGILPESLRDIACRILFGKYSDIPSVAYIPTLFLAFYLTICGLMLCGCILKDGLINMSKQCYKMWAPTTRLGRL